MAKKKSGRKKTDGAAQGAERVKAGRSNVEFTAAVVFLIAAVFSFGRAAHVYLGLDYAPAFVGLGLFLALVGWTAGGGMGDVSRFDQYKGMIGMGVALILLTAAAPFLCPPCGGVSPAGGDSVDAEADGGGEWHPSLGDDSKGGPAQSGLPGGFDGQGTAGATTGGASSPSALALLAGLKNAPPMVPEGPPDETRMKLAAESARRFLWGFVNGDEAVMEGESADGSLAFLKDLKVPEAWRAEGGGKVPLDSIVVMAEGYDGSRIEVDLKVGEKGRARVLLGKDIDWEVTGLVVEP